ncbi:hypothetical protein [Salidesulfovibrio onnuriiensis]|uniref:hypothetical protein n=1 Tax=Salidesulfovibrio onnuriiensis TaxID=2583823 RepID=UPI0011CB2635|nr:hypothetical protein [Salidesulfovibrio onnuriiensis]
MEDLERAALFEAVCSWFQRQYHYARLPFGPAQVYFYDRVVADIQEDEDAGIELDPQIWAESHPWQTLGLSLVAGSLLGLVFMLLAAPWGWASFLWVALGGGVLLVYPVMLMHRNRKVVEVTEGEGADLETVRQIALACLDSSLLRWCLHRVVDMVFLMGWASYSRGVARLAAEEYAASVGEALDRAALSARERRGTAVAEKLAELLGEGGLPLMLKYF